MSLIILLLSLAYLFYKMIALCVNEINQNEPTKADVYKVGIASLTMMFGLIMSIAN